MNKIPTFTLAMHWAAVLGLVGEEAECMTLDEVHAAIYRVFPLRRAVDDLETKWEIGGDGMLSRNGQVVGRLDGHRDLDADGADADPALALKNTRLVTLGNLRLMRDLYCGVRADVMNNLNKQMDAMLEGRALETEDFHVESRFISIEIPKGATAAQYDTFTTQFSFYVPRENSTSTDWVTPCGELYSTRS